MDISTVVPARKDLSVDGMRAVLAAILQAVGGEITVTQHELVAVEGHTMCMLFDPVKNAVRIWVEAPVLYGAVIGVSQEAYQESRHIERTQTVLVSQSPRREVTVEGDACCLAAAVGELVVLEQFALVDGGFEWRARLAVDTIERDKALRATCSTPIGEANADDRTEETRT